MLRPQMDGDAVLGPFMARRIFKPSFRRWDASPFRSERFSSHFLPKTWTDVVPARLDYARGRLEWFATFYPSKPSVAAAS